MSFISETPANYVQLEDLRHESDSDDIDVTTRGKIITTWYCTIVVVVHPTLTHSLTDSALTIYLFSSSLIHPAPLTHSLTPSIFIHTIHPVPPHSHSFTHSALSIYLFISSLIHPVPPTVTHSLHPLHQFISSLIHTINPAPLTHSLTPPYSYTHSSTFSSLSIQSEYTG